MKKIYKWQISRKGEVVKSGSTIYEGDIYLIMKDEYGVIDFAMDMLVWCEEANPGDVHDDGEVRIECVCE